MNPVLMILILIVGLPLVELYVLIEVGSEIGALTTIALSILTAILGTALVRWQGLSVLVRMQTILARGEAPAIELLEGVVLLFCGLMLLFPGFLTDALGFLLLMPSLRRRWIQWWLFKHFRPAQPKGSIKIIEGKVRKKE